MTGYTWTVTGGSITSGAGTNSIVVTWGAVGAGVVSVNYTNGNQCTASSPATRNVTVSPLPAVQQTLTNITVANGQSYCADAIQTIFVAGSGTPFTVSPGGIVHLVAGQHILLYPGTKVNSGGTFHAYIANDCLYCTAPKEAPIAAAADSIALEDRQTVVSGNDLFRVFPNPTTGTVTLEVLRPSGQVPSQLEVFGMQGNPVLKMTMDNRATQTINIGETPAGLYIIRVISGNETATARIVKL
jgi:hypothetical protein